MNISVVRAVMAEAHTCALVMMENANYIQSELPNVRMSDELRAQTEDICATFVGTKHDIITEVSELDELLDTDVSDEVIYTRAERIVRWLQDDMNRMHELVVALKDTSEQDPEYGGAFVLVAESAANALNAFNRTREAADPLLHKN